MICPILRPPLRPILRPASLLTPAPAAVTLYRSNGSVADYGCTTLTGWTDADTLTGSSTQGTYDGRSCFIMATGATQGAIAYRHRGIPSTPSVPTGDWAFTCVVNPLTIGSYVEATGNYAGQYFQVFNGSRAVQIIMATNGIWHRETSPADGYVLAADALPAGWSEVTAHFKSATNTLDLYVDGLPVASALACSYTTSTNFWGVAQSSTTGQTAKTSYFDRIMLGSGLTTY